MKKKTLLISCFVFFLSFVLFLGGLVFLNARDKKAEGDIPSASIKGIQDVTFTLHAPNLRGAYQAVKEGADTINQRSREEIKRLTNREQEETSDEE